jgi:hypothetical protein
MNNGEEQVERRRMFKRFCAPENAVVVFQPPGIVGSIVHIGMGGLTFLYTDIATEEQPMESSELDIILLDREFCLEKVPFKSLTELELQKATIGLRTVAMKRCDVQFGDLTPQQMSQLEYFLQNYTTDV